MDKQEMNKYVEAVDFVCLRCTEDTLNDDDICNKCPVRKSMDIYKKENKNRVSLRRKNYVRKRKW